jgi:hypothetical protein
VEVADEMIQLMMEKDLENDNCDLLRIIMTENDLHVIGSIILL